MFHVPFGVTMKRNWLSRLLTVSLLFASLVSLFQPRTGVQASASSPIYTVNSDADTNVSDASLTLREAILISNGGTGVTGLNRPLSSDEQAQAPDCLFDAGAITGQCGAGVSETIQFSLPSAAIIPLASALPVVSDIGFGLTITGPSASNLTVSGAGSSRVFQVASGATAFISNLTIADGYGNGAGILNYGTLTLQNSILTGNDSMTLGYGGGLGNLWGTASLTNVTFTGNAAADGSAIYNTGTLTLQNSTINNNGGSDPDSSGGAITNNGGQATIANSTLLGNHADNGGAIFNSGTLTLQTSTLRANSGSVTGLGGGLFNGGGTATITNVTFTGNDAGDGGAIYNTGGVIYLYSSTLYDNASSGSSSVLNESSRLTAKNTIIASSLVGNSCAGYDFESVSVGNFSDDASCGASFAQKTIAEIGLGALADNGGPTQTFALLLGSHALNAGNDASCPATDQRGIARPKGSHCDIGSFEMEVSSVLLEPASIVFDDEPVKTTSASQTVTVTNVSADDLNIGLLSITGDFILDDNTCNNLTLSSGESCSFTVAFYPLTAALKSGKVSIPSNSPTSPDTVTLSGRGITGLQLLRDGGFDTLTKRPVAWRGTHGDALSSVRDCAVYITPFCSARLSGNSVNKEKYLSQWVSVARKGLAGTKYYIALSSRAEDVPVDGRYELVVEFYDSRRKLIISENPVLPVVMKFTPGTHDFETLRATVIAPVKHSFIRFVLYYQNTSGTAWFDVAFLVRVQ
jgi:hypothetical protein